jgi:hypothetical protein
LQRRRRRWKSFEGDAHAGRADGDPGRGHGDSRGHRHQHRDTTLADGDHAAGGHPDRHADGERDRTGPDADGDGNGDRDVAHGEPHEHADEHPDARLHPDGDTDHGFGVPDRSRRRDRAAGRGGG